MTRPLRPEEQTDATPERVRADNVPAGGKVPRTTGQENETILGVGGVMSFIFGGMDGRGGVVTPDSIFADDQRLREP